MPNDLKKLLELYHEEVRKYLANHNKMILIPMLLDEKFLQECERRIIAGHKKYGNDWKKKDCIREINFEKFDIFNYKMLDGCQKTYRAKKAIGGRRIRAG